MAKKSPPDLGTPELKAKHPVMLELVGADRGNAKRIRRLDSCELDRLYHLGHITQDQQSAGITLMNALLAAGMVGARASNYEPSIRDGDPQPMSSAKAKAIKSVGYYMTAISLQLGRSGVETAMDCLAFSIPTRNLNLLQRVLDVVYALPSQHRAVHDSPAQRLLRFI
jgi:hypothetical protein